MALNVWTKLSGINLCETPSYGTEVPTGNFVVGKKYVIVSLGNTDFRLLGANYNQVGEVFTSTSAGILSETGTASECWLNERVEISKTLPVQNDTDVTYTIISGALPNGLRLSGNKIVGTPYEVSRPTTFTFCIRASKNGQISDRTFSILIEGSDPPVFVTPEGSLEVGQNNQLFALDSTYIDYQIEAFDQDTAAGQKLTYFIASGDGELPPGLVLTSDGRIVGFIQPALSISQADGDGSYGSGYYDTVAYDFGYRPTNGYDSYVYDTQFYDYSLAYNRPLKLNRNYEFIISVTDGDTISKRKFRIFVVSDDYFRADNTTWLHDNGLFTADVTYLRAPVWLTPSNLGTFRANNYVTLILDVYDTGPIAYTLDTPNSLPPGMNFDSVTAEVYGRIPYQPAITKTYSFTITATRYGDDGEVANSSRTFTMQVVGEVDSVISWATDSDLGSINANFISTLKVEATSTINNAVMLYSVTSGRLPPGLTLDLDGEIVGKVNQYGDGTVYKSFWKAGRQYSLNDVVKYNNIFYKATIPNSSLSFNINQWVLHTFSDSGLILLDGESFTLDQDATSIDRVYTFTVVAKDQFNYSATSKTFSITVNTPNKLTFSNIRTKPYLKTAQRLAWRDFIDNTSIFTPKSIYRPNDPNFGLQTELNMLIYAGIETTEAAKYISAIGLNHKRKRFTFGNVKKAIAKVPGTNNIVYEVVYVEMFDPLEPNGKKLPNKITTVGKTPSPIRSDLSNSIWSRSINNLSADYPDAMRPDPILTVDSLGYTISDPNVSTYYPSSVSIWRDRLKNWRENPNDLNSAGFETERFYLPLWMRSSQESSKQELGFTLAVPLCFCKPGTADDIILNIKFSGFDFKVLDYTVDRYIIDAVEGSTGDKYLVFKNDRITV